MPAKLQIIRQVIRDVSQHASAEERCVRVAGLQWVVMVAGLGG